MSASRQDRAARRKRFEALYAEHYAPIYRYVDRRVDGPEVPDVVAEVFTAAWRRLDDIPEGEATRVWLYGLARNSLLNHRRGRRCRWRLLEPTLYAVALTARRRSLPDRIGAASVVSHTSRNDRRVG
jgi:RNA polymerase sigma-70 factor (ECF subfamily)